MRSRFLTCRDREIHFTEWGPQDGEAVVVWHGLTQTVHSFDTLNAVLGERYRVICPATIGRGLSQWAEDPATEYSFDNYCALAIDLLDQLGIDRMRWAGTSMGGALGLILAGGALRDRITHLFLNDIGPDMNVKEARQGMAERRAMPTFETLTEFEAFITQMYTTLSNVRLSDEQWRIFAEASARRTDAGKITMHHDPEILAQIEHMPDDFDMWDDYDRITAKTLVFHGGRSNVLSAEGAAKMSERGPRAEVITFPDIGHAPFLADEGEIKLVVDFFASST